MSMRVVAENGVTASYEDYVNIDATNSKNGTDSPHNGRAKLRISGWNILGMRVLNARQMGDLVDHYAPISPCMYSSVCNA